MLPQLRTTLDEWMDLPEDKVDALVAAVTADVVARQADGGVVTINPFKPDATFADFPKSIW